jgi:hypothetical protein
MLQNLEVDVPPMLQVCDQVHDHIHLALSSHMQPCNVAAVATRN